MARVRINYASERLSIKVFPFFLKVDDATAIFQHLLAKVPWPRPHRNKDGQLSRRRNKRIYGDQDLVGYVATFRGKVNRQEVLPWDDMPILATLRDMVAANTGEEIHVAVLQLYNNGKTSIEKHRDKEMLPGTIISSISLGCSRWMVFSRSGFADIRIPLGHGSLCNIEPPTNEIGGWLHSIPSDDSEEQRMSIVFRNCSNMKKPEELQPQVASPPQLQLPV